MEIIYILGGTKIKANILSGSFAGNCIIVQNKIKMSIVYCYMLHLKYKAKMHQLQKDKKYVDKESTRFIVYILITSLAVNTKIE